MPTEVRYSRGTTEFPEDAFVFLPRGRAEGRFGVIDGVSSPYPFGTQPPLYERMTSGQLVVSCLLDTTAHEPLRDAAANANWKVRDTLARAGFNTDDPGFLPGCSFVLGDIREKKNGQLIQAGDCMAVWEQMDGHVKWTPNPVLSGSLLVRAERERLTRKLGDRAAALRKSYETIIPKLNRKLRNRPGPGGHAFLDGNPAFLDHVRLFALPPLRRIVMITDGMIREEDSGRKNFGPWFLDLYDKGGFDGLLAARRSEEQKENEPGSRKHKEATLVCWEPM